jgi:2-polyprenyl-3-methyl-5-hydroxy-6-metoxy-1,4-benzoquinol methylase
MADRLLLIFDRTSSFPTNLRQNADKTDTNTWNIKVEYMIKVLTNWQEIGEATKFLSKKNLPKHRSGEKNWDLVLLCQLIDPLSRNAKIIDLGCSGVDTLKFLHSMSFNNLIGVDLNITMLDRINQLAKMWQHKTLHPPFKLRKIDLTNTAFPASHFDFAACISVIEHGVDFERFIREATRLLKPDGILFVTADYWEEKIDTTDVEGEFGLTWKILAKDDVHHIIETASQNGLSPYENTTIPPCREKCVVWNNKEFTFISLAFKKANN